MGQCCVGSTDVLPGSDKTGPCHGPGIWILLQTNFASVSDSPIYTQLNKDATTAQSCPFVSEIWIQEYLVIRKCNTIIERVAGVDDKVLTAKEKLRIDAEARFLRAFCYFDLGRDFW